MIALSLGFWFFCFIFIHLTFKANSAFTRWFLILMPLYAFYPLAIFPMNSPITMIVWLPVTICFIVSFIMLIGRIIDYAVGGRGPYYKQKLVRPILMILVFIGAFTYHHASENKAIAYTIDLAKQIQYQCDQTGKCPDLSGRRSEDANSDADVSSETKFYNHEFKKNGIPYHLIFEVEPDNTFIVRLITGFNMGMYVKGGVGQTLQAVYVTEGSTRDIPIPD